jgi:hypothetical protein
LCQRSTLKSNLMLHSAEGKKLQVLGFFFLNLYIKYFMLPGQRVVGSS